MNPEQLEANQKRIKTPQEKQTGKNKFITVPILLNEAPLDLKVISRMKIFSHSGDELTYSLGIKLEGDNLLEFDMIEKALQKLAEEAKPDIKKISPRLANFRKEEFKILKNDKSGTLKLYPKLYAKKGKITAPFSVVFSEENKTKKPFDPHEIIGVPFQGTAVLRINRLFVGNIKSVTLVTKEVLVHEVIHPKSFFDEYDNASDNSE